MAWKGVHISRPARLSLRDKQIVVSQTESEVTMPVEDVAWIVLDSTHISLSASLVAACMEAGIAVVFSDERHTPSGMAVPFHRHHRQAAIAGMQVNLNLPIRKRLWQAVVTAKIENQAACLKACGKDPDPLKTMARLVASGDPNNIEARAAREYWRRLFTDFIRSNEADLRNKMLNYGYAVVRACVARALVANGLLPCFGIHHDSATNAFNLADDLVEPFRPLVDRRVFEMTAAGMTADGDFSVDQRRSLAALLNADTVLLRETVSVLTATERASESLVRAMETSSPALLCLPKL